MTDDQLLTAEIQEHADRILALIGHPNGLRSGQLVIHFNEFLVQRTEANDVFKLRPVSQQLTRPSR